MDADSRELDNAISLFSRQQENRSHFKKINLVDKGADSHINFFYTFCLDIKVEDIVQLRLFICTKPSCKKGTNKVSHTVKKPQLNSLSELNKALVGGIKG